MGLSGRVSQFRANKTKHSKKLRILTSTPFDLDNEDHINALKSYIDNFECTVNQMYLVQSLTTGFYDWKGIWLLGWVLPLPSFIQSLVVYFFYVNVAGCFIDRFSMDRFCNQLSEMELIYSWCLKGGKEEYDGKLDNRATLAHPEIQHLIKLMAPLIEDTEFMIAWPKETTPNTNEQSGIGLAVSAVGNAAAAVYSGVSTLYSWFPSANKPKEEKPAVVDKKILNVRDLKVAVETRSFDVDVLGGLKQAMGYFAYNPEFRKILFTELKQVKEILPEQTKALFSSPHTA